MPHWNDGFHGVEMHGDLYAEVVSSAVNETYVCEMGGLMGGSRKSIILGRKGLCVKSLARKEEM